jgi:hypothetical protein
MSIYLLLPYRHLGSIFDRFRIYAEDNIDWHSFSNIWRPWYNWQRFGCFLWYCRICNTGNILSGQQALPSSDKLRRSLLKHERYVPTNWLNSKSWLSIPCWLYREMQGIVQLSINQCIEQNTHVPISYYFIIIFHNIVFLNKYYYFQVIFF